jgi:hypothetical protein
MVQQTRVFLTVPLAVLCPHFLAFKGQKKTLESNQRHEMTPLEGFLARSTTLIMKTDFLVG